jgi:hypothetical protein
MNLREHFQRSPNDHKAHEEVFTIPGHKGNANQNHVESISLLFEWLSSRTQTTTNFGKDIGKKEPSCTTSEKVN